MKREETRLMLRLPPDAKAFIATQTARNASSQNSEIVRCIRERMERMAAAGAEIGVLSPAAAGNTTTQENDDAAQK
jgi:hypothetical protein